MVNGGIVIVNTSLMSVGSNVVTGGSFSGGQGVFVIAATQLAPIVNLIYKAGNGLSAQQIKMNSGLIVANSAIPMYLPPGTYEVHSATGSSIGLYAALMPTN